MRSASSSSVPAADPLISSQVGEFIINERIGAGGMGVVYRATHCLIGKQAAIKVLRADIASPRLQERLLVEARSVNAIQHPGIIDIFGFGALPDGRPYIVMELLRGRALCDFAPTPQRLDVSTTVWVLDHMLAALGAAHAAGVVHRDLKPANVFVVELPGAEPSLKLVDFGIAKLLESRDGPTTLDGSILGTPEFMAPEQIRGGEVGPATDLYAVGIIAFQMLTGTRPFQGDPVQVMFAHIDRIPPMPSSRAEGIPPELDTLVLHLLAKDPALRPASAEAARQQLQRISPGARKGSSRLTARSATRTAAPSKPQPTPDTMTLLAPRRAGSPVWWVGGVVLLAGLGGAFWFSRPASSEAPALAMSEPAPEPQTNVAPFPAPPPTESDPAAPTQPPVEGPAKIASASTGQPSSAQETTSPEDDQEPVPQAGKASVRQTSRRGKDGAVLLPGTNHGSPASGAATLAFMQNATRLTEVVGPEA
ncbi:serine/threonine-protein kinase, partial [Corallococcus terminator]|uniref:serine/threonine-protein kinase n=1 Tax=Corallococcus terminator TaxID=2316733 RepID=UPI001FC9BCBE